MTVSPRVELSNRPRGSGRGGYFFFRLHRIMGRERISRIFFVQVARRFCRNPRRISRKIRTTWREIGRKAPKSHCAVMPKVHNRYNDTGKTDEDQRILEQVSICQHMDRPLSLWTGGKEVFTPWSGANRRRQRQKHGTTFCRRTQADLSAVLLTKTLLPFLTGALWWGIITIEEALSVDGQPPRLVRVTALRMASRGGYFLLLFIIATTTPARPMRTSVYWNRSAYVNIWTAPFPCGQGAKKFSPPGRGQTAVDSADRRIPHFVEGRKEICIASGGDTPPEFFVVIRR